MDFCFFVTQFFYTKALHLVNVAIIFQFFMSTILVVYFVVMKKWGVAKGLNKKLEEMDLAGERENLVKNNTSINV